MKSLLLTTLLLLSFSVQSEEDCMLDQERVKEFRSDYLAKNPSTSLAEDGATIIINRGGQKINFWRGGCHHFGVRVSTKYTGELSETEFFAEAIELMGEFATELVQPNKLQEMFTSKKYREEDGVYFLQPYGETFFEGINHKDGRVEITIYQ